MKQATAISCALARCQSYGDNLEQAVFQVLQAANLPCKSGMRVLVKPNLLTAKPLACTQPQIVAAACKWLLEAGCRVEVADSPGFGRPQGVARAIGLDGRLAPLGLAVLPMDRPVPLKLKMGWQKNPIFMVSARALECDYILSAPRIKAHAQMRISLALKNCFGCVCGARKAIIHAREGREPELFARALAALWAALPPVGALADGVEAMHVTGPTQGSPYMLGLLGASSSAAALDRAILRTLHIPLEMAPLNWAAAQREDCPETDAPLRFPLLAPEDFDAQGFVVPRELAHTSFRPARLLKSLCRRIWAAVKPARQSRTM